jgi:hypothetical protein
MQLILSPQECSALEALAQETSQALVPAGGPGPGPFAGRPRPGEPQEAAATLHCREHFSQGRFRLAVI